MKKNNVIQKIYRINVLTMLVAVIATLFCKKHEEKYYTINGVCGSDYTCKIMHGIEAVKFMPCATDGRFIYVTEIFMRLPLWLQKMLITHEIGHVYTENGLPKDQAEAEMQGIARHCGISNIHEFNADAYVVKYFGKAKTLLMLATLLPINMPEIVQRMLMVIKGHKIKEIHTDILKKSIENEVLEETMNDYLNTINIYL